MQIARRLFAAFLVLCLAHPVLGQTEKIALYADAAGTDCSITDITPGVIEVHIVHVGVGGRRGSVFRAPKPACWAGAVWLGDVISPNFLFIGTTQSNRIDVVSPVCFQLPMYIGKMNFFAAGTGQACCEYPVLPAVPSDIPGSVFTEDCQVPFGNLIVIGGGSATINENSSCLCDPPLAVEETTWGRVKALYR